MAQDGRSHTQAPYNTLPPLSSMTQGVSLNGAIHKPPPSSYEVRDSGNWSIPSKHSSVVSSNTGISHLLNPDDSSRSRLSGTSNISSASHGSSGAAQGLPHLNQGYPRRGSDAAPGTFLDSRRSSVDSSRMSMNMNQLGINHPSSPYESTNASQTSLTSNLQHQRGIHTPVQPRLNGIPNHVSPLNGRPRTAVGRRQAPQIAPPSRVGVNNVAMANDPTPGLPWAFPEAPTPDDDDDVMSSPSSSRAGSFALGHSHDPPQYQHGSLQPRSVTSLQSVESTATGGTGNYSRTPELRVSHKLAERKRRSEMKELFDQLNQQLPNSPGSKSSKWEVLTKATEYIHHVQASMASKTNEIDLLRAEVQRGQKAQEEVRALESEIATMHQQLCRVDPSSPHSYGPRTQMMEQQRPMTSRLAPMQQPGQPLSSPLATNGQNWNQSSGAMTGIEYGSSYDRR